MCCKLSIVMPCLDEARTVGICTGKALGFLARYGVTGEVVVADNGSRDGSQAITLAAGARVVNVPHKGYGHALRGGIETSEGKYVIMGDADNSYDFAALDRFVDLLRDGYDMVMGNRF
ncbi:MAG: glycosyltransferase family 2 protein, partial [Bacteroidales bacterium]|nr:glycosyltransferase family 2 protein [Bacteroidales bacterium]